MSWRIKEVYGRPVAYSDEYDDVYFSPEDGRAESRYTFFEGNRLQERSGRISVGELGFGTGLNFFQTWKDFKGTLSYTAFEKRLLSLDQIRESLGAWSDLAPLIDQFAKRYRSEFEPGIHRLLLGDCVRLTLVVGDAQAWIHQLSGRIDAWFLDGFSPKKNPELWSDSVFAGVARMSGSGTTFASFSSAGHVQRGLKAAGFEVQKKKGFWKKREMIFGEFRGTSQSSDPPWLRWERPEIPARVSVLGAGIAGSTVARAFAERGVEVVLHEKQDQIAGGASGAPAAVFFPNLTAKLEPLSELSIAGFRLNRQLHPGEGVLQILDHPRSLRRLKAAFLENYYPWAEWIPVEEVSRRVQGNAKSPGVFYPEAGWIHPRDWIGKLLDHPKIELRLNSSAPETETVIDATASGLDIVRVRGQLDRYEGSPPVDGVLSYEGTYIPTSDSSFVTGSTFDRGNESSEASSESSRQMADRYFSATGRRLDSVVSSWVGFRAVTVDSLPLLGPVPDREFFESSYRNLSARNLPEARWMPGRYACAGLGSRGVTSSPILAEILASLLCGEVLPIRRELYQALSSTRFLIRALKKGSSLLS